MTLRSSPRAGGRLAATALAFFCLLATSSAHEADSAVPLPVAGDMIAPFDAKGVDGVLKKVSFNGRGSTVLLFFLSSCPTCHRMIPEWNRAYQRKPQGLEVIGVLMDQEPPGFFMTNPVAFPVVRSPNREFLQKLKISRAPLMVRVAKGGKVEDVQMGLTDPIRVGEIFRP
jgi:hypothetical protein